MEGSKEGRNIFSLVSLNSSISYSGQLSLAIPAFQMHTDHASNLRHGQCSLRGLLKPPCAHHVIQNVISSRPGTPVWSTQGSYKAATAMGRGQESTALPTAGGRCYDSGHKREESSSSRSWNPSLGPFFLPGLLPFSRSPCLPVLGKAGSSLPPVPAPRDLWLA